MVTALSQEIHRAIRQAIRQAEARTHAQIAVVVSPASDAYQSYVLLYGLALGSFLSLALWFCHALDDFPLLLLMQVAVMAIVSLVPVLRRLCLKAVPRRTLHHRAAHRAYEEYMTASRHVAKETPFVLFYVSLAERYAHILPSHAAREKVPHEAWEQMVQKFIALAKNTSLESACLQAVGHIADELAPHFTVN